MKHHSGSITHQSLHMSHAWILPVDFYVCSSNGKTRKKNCGDDFIGRLVNELVVVPSKKLKQGCVQKKNKRKKGTRQKTCRSS